MLYITVEEMLEREAAYMGRPVTIRNAWQCVFQDKAGVEHTLTTLVYQCAPLTVQEFTIEEARFAVYIDGVARTGGSV